MVEGEKLSKKQLTQETTIRKLRSQIREMEAEQSKASPLDSGADSHRMKVHLKQSLLCFNSRAACQQITEGLLKNSHVQMNLLKTYWPYIGFSV